MATELNLLRMFRRDAIVLSDCLYTLVTDQWNQMHLAVAKQSFVSMQCESANYFLSHIEHTRISYLVV